MEKKRILEQDSKSAIRWLGLAGGCTLSVTLVCSLVLAILLLVSMAFNAYMAWTMAGYEIVISKPTSGSTLLAMITATGELAGTPTPTLPPTAVPSGVLLTIPTPTSTSIPMPTPTVAPTSTATPLPTQSTLEAGKATPTATAAPVAETDVEVTEVSGEATEISGEATEISGTASGSLLAVALEPSPKTVSAPPPEAIGYIVQENDTLWLIAEREYGSGLLWEIIFEANRDTLSDPDHIWPGQVLNIPVTP